MTEPLQPTPDDATLPGRAEVTRAAASDGTTLPAKPQPQVRPQSTVSQLHARERYALGCEVARGGMGAILRATDLSIDRTVAMKVALDQASADAEILQRFTQEAKLTGQLEHPNIVPVYDLSSDEQDRTFYTMKFVQGTTLHDILAKLWSGDAATVVQYSLAHLLTIFQKVCDAVAFAHSRNVIHRDLKPANIMVGEYGEVLVMDWGLAKVVGEKRSEVSDQKSEAGSQQSPISDLEFPNSASPGLTLDGQIMGSPQYMAPEQAEGEIDKLDARTDIFALGGVLYNILTLHPPVSGKSVEEMLEQIRTGAILPPTSYNPKTGKKTPGTVKVGDKSFPQPPLIPLRHCPGGRIPDSLGAVAMKALALKQEDRYQSVPELQKDIEAYQGGFATGAEKASAWRQLALLVKRHKKEFALAAVALAVLVATVAGFLVKVTKEKNRAEVNERRAEKTLGQLHDTAPTYYEQAQVLIEQRQWSNAMEKASIATALAPEVADYQVLYGNLLQTDLQIAEAKEAYATALQRQPDHKLAKENLALCEEFLSDDNRQHRLTTLNHMQSAMLRQGRTAEAGAFTRFIQQSATDRNEALTAWSNVLVKAGIEIKLFNYDPIVGLRFWVKHDRYTNDTLAPFQGMPINHLNLGISVRNVRDLSPLRGMPLTFLLMHDAPITNLSPLQGMKLTNLNLALCKKLTDLAPLRGMPLEQFLIASPGITNLSPLQGMPLTLLRIPSAQVTDLTPLTGMRLTYLDIMGAKVSDLSPLRGMSSLKNLTASGTPVSDLSPLKGIVLETLNISGTRRIKDWSPLQGMSLIHCQLSDTSINDLSVLKGMPLLDLCLNNCPITDLSPLRGMPLKALYLAHCAKLQELTPLMDCKQLENLVIPETCKNIECLRLHSTLKELSFSETNKVTVAEFWKTYDAAKTNAPAAKPTNP